MLATSLSTPLVGGQQAAGGASRRQHRQPTSRLRSVRVFAEASEGASSTCRTCGVKLSEAPGGCDGQGRVVGGVGALFSWWPIKAYRPCSNLAQAGVQYQRKGGDLNTTLFPTPKQQRGPGGR